ncbi:MAG: hypothetical protein GYA57_22170 [Myxococcales bacterium]|nr:hypothetical protein [Myxococcales bacterium]
MRSDLIDAAVREINRLYVGKGIEAARAVGEYVLRTFFGGRVEHFRRRGRKHVSFRKLAERPDLRVSHATLWKCTALVEQFRELPPEVTNALPVTHHVLLLPVHDDKCKLALARKAVREGLSKTALAAEVRRLGRPSPTARRRGRPPSPPVVRLLSAFARLARQSAAPSLLDRSLDEFPPHRLADLVAAATRDLEQLGALVRKLRERLDASTIPRPGPP